MKGWWIVCKKEWGLGVVSQQRRDFVSLFSKARHCLVCVHVATEKLIKKLHCECPQIIISVEFSCWNIVPCYAYFLADKHVLLTRISYYTPVCLLCSVFHFLFLKVGQIVRRVYFAKRPRACPLWINNLCTMWHVNNTYYNFGLFEYSTLARDDHCLFLERGFIAIAQLMPFCLYITTSYPPPQIKKGIWGGHSCRLLFPLYLSIA